MLLDWKAKRWAAATTPSVIGAWQLNGCPFHAMCLYQQVFAAVAEPALVELAQFLQCNLEDYVYMPVVWPSVSQSGVHALMQH